MTATIDPFDIHPDAPVDMELVNEAQTKLSQLSQDMVSNKMAEAKLFQDSMADGGPSSTLEAVLCMMDYTKIGVRQLAAKTGMRRKHLQQILRGEVQLDASVLSKLEVVFRQLKPSLFA